jgi:ABC-type nitrate/sulfonate/bicarbonate transport system permease component
VRVIVAIVALLGFWQTCVWVTGAAPYIFPGPIDVANAGMGNASLIITNLAITLLISVASLCIGIAAATGTALLMSYYQRMGPTVAILLAAFQAIPVVALAPYFLIWFGPGAIGRVLMAVAVVYVPACFVMWNGLRRMDSDIGMLFKAYNVPRWESFKRFRMYLAAPFVLAAIELTASLAVIGAVIAELAGSQDGIGAVILRASYSMKTDLVFAVLLSAAIVSAILFKVISSWTESARKRFAVTGITS